MDIDAYADEHVDGGSASVAPGAVEAFLEECREPPLRVGRDRNADSTHGILQDYGINHARRVYRSNRLTELRAAGAGGEGATRPCVIRYDPHNPMFVWVEHGDEFVPFRCVGDLLDEPMGGEIWQAAHAVDTATDTATREEVAYLADRMKRAQWVRPGKERNRAVRAAEVDRDPMHMTGVSKTIARETPTTEPDDDEVIWERGGGFLLLTDDDGVWERLT